MTFHPPVFGIAKTRKMRVVPMTLTVFFLIVAFGFGWVAGDRWGGDTVSNKNYGKVIDLKQAPPLYLTKDVDFGLFWKIWDHINRTSLERPIPDTKLFYGALQGLVAGLGDPYSVFMDPGTAKRFAEELQGSFEGIGAEIGIRDNRLVIIAPLPNTPAERSGLKSGDVIAVIGDTDTSGLSVDQAVSLIRGKRGTKVSLLVYSNGDKEPRRVDIKRERITIEIVKGEIKKLSNGNSVAYIRIVHFASDTDRDFKAVWRKLAAQGPKAIIIDLRNNPGGFLDQAIEISGHWLGDSVIVKEQLPPPEVREYRGTGAGELKSIPTVVLINQGSASASEIVAGALQDAKLATLIGEKSFGKGSVQDLEEFADGSSVKLTIAKWFTPAGRSIDKNGIKPDVEVVRSKDDIEKKRDPQLDKALEILNR